MASMRIENLGKAELTLEHSQRKRDIIGIRFCSADGLVRDGKFSLKDLRTVLKAPRGTAVVVNEAYTFGLPE